MIHHCVCTGYDDISDCIDLIICLGGDGTLLYASSLFQVFSHLTLAHLSLLLGQFQLLSIRWSLCALCKLRDLDMQK